MLTTSPEFKANAHHALADAGLQKALAFSKPQFMARRTAAVANLPEFERLRDIGRDIKNHALANLDFYLETFEANVQRAGGHVHWCSTAEDARAAVLEICRSAGARTVTKGKSMISEELGINAHLEAHGIAPIETDLGEYIIQLRQETPSHIIAPAVHVNRDPITHRYDSMVVDPQGRIFIAWIDKRDGEAKRALKQEYTGAAIYYTVSTDRGATFAGDFKVADHSCECCRIALTVAPDGKVTALWRHVFAPNVRDHAMAVLSPTGAVSPLERATFDDWRIDACPHHGPAMAFAANGTRHQAWFGVKGEEGGVYYASAAPGKATGQPLKLGNDQAAHPAVAVDGANVVLAWRQFDGKATAILAKVSHDSGATWNERELARTAQASDYPALLNTGKGIALAWRTQAEGLRILPLSTEKKP